MSILFYQLRGFVKTLHNVPFHCFSMFCNGYYFSQVWRVSVETQIQSSLLKFLAWTPVYHKYTAPFSLLCGRDVPSWLVGSPVHKHFIKYPFLSKYINQIWISSTTLVHISCMLNPNSSFKLLLIIIIASGRTWLHSGKITITNICHH